MGHSQVIYRATCCLYGKVHAPFATRLNIRQISEHAAQIEEAVAMV
jgi:hypothetical protein